MGKKILTFVLALCLALAMIPLTAQAAGADTEWYTKDPSADTFYIGNADELAGLAKLGEWQNYVSFEGKTIVLTADIDLFEYPSWPSMYTSLSNYAFKGTFDGRNHVISNLKGETFFGAVIGSTIKNVFISNASVTGGSILATQVSTGGVIDNCGVSGKTSGGNNVGAITGLVNGGTVTNCITMATITANTNSGAGGLIYNSTSNNTVVTNNAVLNYAVYGKRPASANVIGRVVGYNAMGEYSGNVAYDGTIVQDKDSADIEIVSDAAGKHGQSITKAEIYASGILDRLPASFPIPDYLQQEPEPDQNSLNVRGTKSETELGAADFVFEALLQKDKVNLIEAEFTFDAEQFSIEAVAVPENLAVNAINVYGADNKVVVVLGVTGQDGAFASAELTSLVNFTLRAAYGNKPETAELALKSATLYSKGAIVEYEAMNESATVALSYRLPLDVNDDGVVNAADLSLVLFYFGATADDANWDEARFADVNGDGSVDMIDITILVEAIFGA